MPIFPLSTDILLSHLQRSPEEILAVSLIICQMFAREDLKTRQATTIQSTTRIFLQLRHHGSFSVDKLIDARGALSSV